jgi:hypothetical protein
MLRRPELRSTSAGADAGSTVAGASPRTGTGTDTDTDAGANAGSDTDTDADADAGTADAGDGFQRFELGYDVVGRTDNRHDAESISTGASERDLSRRTAGNDPGPATDAHIQRPDQGRRSDPAKANGESLARPAHSTAQNGHRELAERQDRPEDNRARRGSSSREHNRPHSHTWEAWQQ